MSRAIIKQVASKLTGFGFDNDPSAAICDHIVSLSTTVSVYRVGGIALGVGVYALVVHKGHSPVSAAHVVDFRIGENIYA